MCSWWAYYETGKYILKTSLKASCVRIHGKVSLIKNIIMSGDAEILIVYQSFQATDSFLYNSTGIKIARDLKSF